MQTRTKSSSSTRSQAIYLTLRERICLLQYPPGSRLSEEELASEFGVSRSPISRVLARLDAENLVDRRHGAGTFVTTLDHDTLEEVIAFRMRLAEMIGELNPLRPDRRELELLRNCRRRLEDIRDHPDIYAFARINMEYFLTTTSLIGNKSLRDVSERLFFETSRMWIYGLPVLDWKEMIAKFMREIDEVAQAMEMGDMRAVGLISRNYISMNMTLLLRGDGPATAPANMAGKPAANRVQ
jgi:DNA-binding GntR family transcriptional regulator